MLRISQYLRALAGVAPRPRSAAPGSIRAPVVIWNLLRRCNLTCKHCYATSTDTTFKGELNTEEALDVIDQLHQAGVRVLVLSGGEPLMRDDLFTLARRASDKGFFLALSTNGTLITHDNIQAIADIGFDYVGISIDGLADVHDEFRRLKGGFAASMNAVDLCRQHDIRVGLRTTLTVHNFHQLPALLDLMRTHDVQKYYLSHMNYSGRGRLGRRIDAERAMTRQAMLRVFEHAWRDVLEGRDTDFVSGNNDADAILLLQWVSRNLPEHYDSLYSMLAAWGGNAAGAGIANIDNIGDVHPDTYWWHHTVGNVRHRHFQDIWFDNPDPLLQRLRQHPRKLLGRCGRCQWLHICNGNTRTRAWADKDLWGQDPGCYLTDTEIGINTPQRLTEREPS